MITKFRKTLITSQLHQIFFQCFDESDHQASSLQQQYETAKQNEPSQKKIPEFTAIHVI